MRLPNNKKLTIIIVPILLGVLSAVYIISRQSSAPIFNYLPYIFGSVSFLGGLYLLLIAFRIYKPKFNTDEKQIRFNDGLIKFGKLWKFCSVILILYGAYNLIWHDPNMYRLNSRAEDNKWTNKDRVTLIRTCMRDAGPMATKYPEITLDYCSCSMDKIMKAVSKEEYINDLSKSVQEQYKIDSPIIQGCLVNYNHRIDSAEKQGK